ncbi:IBR domain, Zinc finger, RING/FYVE/PHD-type, E3 ubiquitin ligase RBR family [Artemisia annua]|uniref:IBR domain, Zinc finger, RING/FYVE/PHD-type, E3 ubiquitin ligase RBR family n=1 Tax=Artemisia annua TaxID=35608 RepID=A0A2U1NNK4_ARTAN|nr:IBR domain, Zinc finger, RING/FYVE/PHD-type, E3 ubiquitin ligase RBR family [Artemisia annua]
MDCMIKYIQLKLQDNVSDIKCPATTCGHFLDPLSCRPILTTQLFNIWCDALCESTVLGVDRVYCPQIECLGLVLNECSESEEMTSDENDIAFGVVCETKDWKRCPNCRFFIERNGGCNVVTCMCGFVFYYDRNWYNAHETVSLSDQDCTVHHP